MGYLAQWGRKGFIISPNKIVPFNNLSTTVSLKADSENDTSGTPATNTRGLEAQVITLSTVYLRAAGTSPREQFEEWTTLVGSANPLYIQGKRFGPPKLQLTSVSLSGAVFNNDGIMLKAEVSITLTEYPDKNASTQSKAASSTKAASVYKSTVAAKTEAMNATASTIDKADKKPSANRGR